MADVLVVGYGNDLRSDDAVGRHVARAVESLGFPEIDVLELHQLTPEVAAAMAGRRLVVFVDAGVGIDEVKVLPIEPAAPSQRSTHHATPAGLVELCRTVSGSAPEAMLVAVPAWSLQLGEELSPEAQRGVAEALEAVVGLATGTGDYSSSCSSQTSTGVPSTSRVVLRSGTKPADR